VTVLLQAGPIPGGEGEEGEAPMDGTEGAAKAAVKAGEEAGGDT